MFSIVWKRKKGARCRRDSTKRVQKAARFALCWCGIWCGCWRNGRNRSAVWSVAGWCRGGWSWRCLFARKRIWIGDRSSVSWRRRAILLINWSLGLLTQLLWRRSAKSCRVEWCRGMDEILKWSGGSWRAWRRYKSRYWNCWVSWRECSMVLTSIWLQLSWITEVKRWGWLL